MGFFLAVSMAIFNSELLVITRGALPLRFHTVMVLVVLVDVVDVLVDVVVEVVVVNCQDWNSRSSKHVQRNGYINPHG